MLRTVVAVAILVGCGKAPGPAPKGPATVQDSFPVGPPLVTPGEKLSYRLALEGLELAVYDFAIGDVVDVDGKKAIVAQSHAKTVGIAGAVKNVDDLFTSWIDVTTGRPIQWLSDETEGKDKEHTLAHLDQRSGNSIPVEFHVNEDPPKPETQTVSMKDVWDYNAMMIALRTWEVPENTSVEAEVFRSRFVWRLKMTAGPKGKIATELGEFPARRLDGHVYKLDRDGKKTPGDDPRDFTVWVSDDDGRVPLLIVAKTDYGNVKLTITAYEPGTGQRLRQ